MREQDVKPAGQAPARSKIEPAATRRAAQRAVPTRQPAGRASSSPVITIDLSEDDLKRLMVEQCRGDTGHYVTVYVGSRTALLAAGVPDVAFPTEDDARSFKIQTGNVCCTGDYEVLRGAMRKNKGDEFELEVDWGHVRPYVQGSHPAVTELARMLLLLVSEFTTTPIGAPPDFKLPFDVLAAHPWATDYKPGRDTPRLVVTPEFYQALKSKAGDLYQFVHTHCEVRAERTANDHPPEASLAGSNVVSIGNGKRTGSAVVT